MGGLQEKALAHAIALFFEAVADPSRWPMALDMLARAMDAEGALIFSTDRDVQVLGTSVGLTPLMDDYVREGWNGHNPRSLAAPFRTSDRFVADHVVLAGHNLDREPYYQEFLRPRGLMWGTAARLWFGDDNEPVILTLERSATAGRFLPPDLEALDRVRADLVRALTLTRALGLRRLDTMLSAWETVNQAVALVDSTGRLIRATRTFSAAIGSGLSLRNRRLVADDPQETAALDAAILGTVGRRPDDTGRSTSLAVRRPPPRAPLVLDILPVPATLEGTLSGTRALVLLKDPSRIVPARPDLLRSAFALSRREAELATLLTSGLDLGEAAEHLGVARPTVRSQLAALFSKTGTRRQAELVALLTRFAGAAEQQAADARNDIAERADRLPPIE